MALNENKIQAVINALDNPKYKWRTIDGVAKETGFDQAYVEEVLKKLSDEIVKSSINSADGRDLFTTRDNFSRQASVGEKILGAIKNRVT